MTPRYSRPWRVARRIALLFILLGCAVPTGAWAQAPVTTEHAPTAPLLAAPSPPRDLDTRLFHAINLHPGHRDALDPVFEGLMPLGTRYAGAIPVSLYALGRWQGDAEMREAGVLTAAALISSALTVEGLKGVVSRQRPLQKLGESQVRVVGKREEDGRSFPSGHTATAFAWATVLSSMYPKGAPAFYGAATGVGFGRVRLGAHYPGDVAAGAAVGYLCGRLIINNRQMLARRGSGAGSGLIGVGVSRQVSF